MNIWEKEEATMEIHYENEDKLLVKNILNVDTITENQMVNPVEWKFIYKIFEDNLLFGDTKISFQYFTDPLAKVFYTIMGKHITQLGEFKLLLHLKDFCEDEARMDAYRNIEYPLDINDPQDIYEYLKLFKDDDIKFETLEYEIQKRYQKTCLEECAYEILDGIGDSNASVKELTAKMSFKIDNLLYESSDDVQAKSTKDVTDDMMAYLSSDDVDEYIPTCVDAIDMQCGGTTVPAVICWAANAKVGKSALLVETIVRNLEQGRTCSVYSIEMNIKEVMLRIYSRYAGVDFTKIGKKEYSQTEKDYLRGKVAEFQERFKDKFFIYFNPNGLSTKTIESHISRLKKSGIYIEDIFVDYLQLLDSTGKPNGTKVEKMIEVPKEVRMLGQKMNIRIFIPAQLKSDAKSKKIEDITGDDIYYAKEIEREAHIVCVLHNEDGHKKFKYLVSRFQHDQDTYFFPKCSLNTMFFGEAKEWDDSYAIVDEKAKKPVINSGGKAEWERMANANVNKTPSWQ